ncbi:unnamed protein product [Lathyrus sativus]|nr:unnamed protein product [Lathyrus sativus]
MGKLIVYSRTTFIPGRKLLGGVVVLNELIDLAKRRKHSCVLFKAYFSKAYDCVDWSYLRKMLVVMGFGSSWLKWMEGGVFKSFMFVLVNGSPTEDFQVYRGLRQGDPLFLFPFAIVVEGFAAMVRGLLQWDI